MKYRVRVQLEDGGTDYIELYAGSPEAAKDLAMTMDGVMEAVAVKALPRTGETGSSDDSVQSHIDHLVG